MYGSFDEDGQLLRGYRGRFGLLFVVTSHGQDWRQDTRPHILMCGSVF